MQGDRNEEMEMRTDFNRIYERIWKGTEKLYRTELGKEILSIIDPYIYVMKYADTGGLINETSDNGQ